MTLSRLAVQALRHWTDTPAAPRLLSHRENAVFAVTLADGEPAALRLHRPGYNSIEDIRWELWWTEALAKRGFPVPRPVFTPKGEALVALDEEQVATVISWVDGGPIGVSSAPLAGTDQDQTTLYHRVGALLARLHQQTDALNLPEAFQRRSWDSDGLLGPDPLWGRFWLHPGLTAAQSDLIGAARAKAVADLAAYQKTSRNFGLIHADALRENVFRSGDALTLIDFDDSGFGYRMFDLAVAVSQSLEDANYDNLSAAIIDGYQTVLPLTPADTSRMALFALLRTFASLGWIVPRLPAGEASHAKFIRRAVMQSERYLSQ